MDENVTEFLDAREEPGEAPAAPDGTNQQHVNHLVDKPQHRQILSRLMLMPVSGAERYCRFRLGDLLHLVQCLVLVVPVGPGTKYSSRPAVTDTNAGPLSL